MKVPFSEMPLSNQKFNLALLFCIPLLTINPVFAASRIGGVFVAHGERFVDMLELTEAQDGKITGVLSTMDLKSDGSISSDDTSITSGTIDGDQLILHLSELAIFGENIAGKVDGNTIRLQSTGKDGSVLISSFQRGSQQEFRTYADHLKSEGQAIVFNSKLMKSTQALRQTVSDAEAWISNADLHAERMPGVKDYYNSLEDRMRSLISQEQRTLNRTTRSQISVAVDQANVAGSQADVQVHQVWDVTIISSGENFAKVFAALPPKCGTLAEFQSRGATQQVAKQWQNACEEVLSERVKFGPAFNGIMKQRDELTSFQAAAESRRQALVKDANRIASQSW